MIERFENAKALSARKAYFNLIQFKEFVVSTIVKIFCAKNRLMPTITYKLCTLFDFFVYLLQNALETWNQFMEKLRSDCPSLNFFTTDQLVVLSRDLAKFVHNKSKNLNTQSLMMLNCIAPNLETKDLLKFVRSHFSGASAEGKIKVYI